MAKNSFKFFHVVRNANRNKILSDFRDGLKPIGQDTADADQKQDSGLYFWATSECAESHMNYLFSDKCRDFEKSDKVGLIEFDIPIEKIKFPDFRFDIERNEARAQLVESYLFENLDILNSDKAKVLRNSIHLEDKSILQSFCIEKRHYVEHKPTSNIGDCLCFKTVSPDGTLQVKRLGVADVENVAVWLASNNEKFKNQYSNFLRYAFSRADKINKLNIAFKYCGEKNLPISKISLVSIDDENNKKFTILYDKNIFTKQKETSR